MVLRVGTTFARRLWLPPNGVKKGVDAPAPKATTDIRSVRGDTLFGFCPSTLFGGNIVVETGCPALSVAELASGPRPRPARQDISRKGACGSGLDVGGPARIGVAVIGTRIAVVEGRLNTSGRRRDVPVWSAVCPPDVRGDVVMAIPYKVLTSVPLHGGPPRNGLAGELAVVPCLLACPYDPPFLSRRTGTISLAAVSSASCRLVRVVQTLPVPLRRGLLCRP